MRKAPLLFVFSSLVSGCLQKSQPSSSSTAIVVDASPSSVASASAEGTRVKEGIGFFFDDKIQACIDHDRTYKSADEASKFKKKLEDLPPKDAKLETLFPGGCTESFKDRVALASCITDHSSEKSKGTTTSTYYTIEAMTGDKAMRDCLTEKGKWEAIPHDSDAYEMADAEAKLKQSKDELKRLQGHR